MKTEEDRLNDIDSYLLGMPKSERCQVFIAHNVDPFILGSLNEKGVEVVDVRFLPRDNPESNRHAIQCWLKGMSNGTIERDDERRKALELSAKMDGLLVQQINRVNANVNVSEETLEALLTFSHSRHTLIDASLEKLEKARIESLSPKKVEGGSDEV